MYKFSIDPSNYLAPSFENKLNMCDRLGCGYVEIWDQIKGRFLTDMSDGEIREMRNLLIDYGKSIALITYTASLADGERFEKLLRVAHTLHVKAIKLTCDGYSDMALLIADLNRCASLASKYGIHVCVENRHGSLLSTNENLESVITACSEHISTVFNPLEYVLASSNPLSHKLNNTLFLRVNDGLSREKTPTMPGRGDAQLKELASLLLENAYDGFFSFTDYFGTMCWADLMEYSSAFREMLKSM